MQPEPANWELLTVSKLAWPDRIRHHVKEDGTVESIFIIDRGNNRTLSLERQQVLTLMEAAGCQIRLCVMGNLMTVAEFNQGIGYRMTMPVAAKSYVYAATSRLKQLEEKLKQTDPADPAFDQILKQIRSSQNVVNAAAEVATPKTPEVIDNSVMRGKFYSKLGEFLHQLMDQGWTNEEALRMQKEFGPFTEFTETAYLGFEVWCNEKLASAALEVVEKASTNANDSGTSGASAVDEKVG